MLMPQMTQVHAATMRTANRFTNLDLIRGSHFKKRGRRQSEKMLALSTVGRTLSNLAGRYTEQLRTLDNHRGGGDQNVMIHNMSVSHGGQAIVGKVTQPERGASSESSQSAPPALTHSPAVPMPLIEPARTVVPRVGKAAKRNGKARS
jgi:hypothetical protein